MERYINADKLYDDLMLMANDEHNKGCFPSVSTVLEDIADYISVLDGADVREVVHGEWIVTGRTNVYGGKEIQCPKCGDTVMVQDIKREHYCRNCGADMRGEK